MEISFFELDGLKFILGWRVDYENYLEPKYVLVQDDDIYSFVPFDNLDDDIKKQVLSLVS